MTPNDLFCRLDILHSTASATWCNPIHVVPPQGAAERQPVQGAVDAAAEGDGAHDARGRRCSRVTTLLLSHSAIDACQHARQHAQQSQLSTLCCV